MRACKWCGSEFHKVPGYSDERFARKMFCSNRCRGAHTSANTQSRVLPAKTCVNCNTEYNPNPRYSWKQWETSMVCSVRCKKVLPTKVCPVCKVVYEVEPYRFDVSKTCSFSCSGKLKRTGTTPIDKIVRQMFAPWRQEVFERDGYACVQCGAQGKLNADHIIPFAQLLMTLDVEKLADVSNGRTLCEPCHRKTPTYGKKLSQYAHA